ncbi:RDD domain containing protein [Cellulomonas flavigena DSM 20109]|uniref:RDD domain containing protein n=1 Tax=Cellulomonas flavigena (strain ATCC 482 / DSM 20109 / BCRC 11376 / JCM 18109 / NBRC 3775 / NCIMB 8073 / NRS 134) TaxID=446466 RepID=D5UJ20_CELFN|nr:RDD family protein [Cellulomonas flavigena]ADG75586.1 RDD domain containing protein [Cellulomonas flavigena DSM 20109]
MSTRASAPRCASCGMPLAPDAGSCAVCGARVPLIARPAAGDDDAAAPDDGRLEAAAAHGPAGAAVPHAGEAADAAPTGARPAVTPAVPPPAPRSTAARSTAPRAAAFDAATAAREVRESARSARAVPSTDAVPPVGTRVLAYAIDVLAAGAAAGLGLLVVSLTGGEGAVLPGLLGLAVTVAQVVAEGRGGATLGSRLLGLRTVDERTGAVPGIGRALVRQLVLGLGTLACLVGNWVIAASGAWDSGPRRRGWHDKASGTAVVLASSRPGGVVAPGGPQRGADAWTPPRPAATSASVPPPASAVPAPSTLEDFLFAPSSSGSGGGPSAPHDAASPAAPAQPPVVVPVAPGPPAPTPVPVREAPGVTPAASVRPAPEPDLLPPPPGAGVAQAPRAAAAAGAVDDDLADLEHTRVRDPETLRRRTGTLSLHFDTGERVRVVGRGLVGRGPRAEDGQDILHVVALQDAARSLSRVHAEFGPVPATDDEDSAIWVADRRSTNGTVVVDPTGVARVLPAGTRALVGAGWTVRLGDREARVEAD